MNSVWIVDDDQSIRWVLERALSREGFDVRAFASARECLRALEDGAPRVLVSDIRMPGESGIELLQKVHERRPSLPVIIMTAYSDLESAVSAFQGGAFEYLPKPFDLPKAVELIRRAMQESERVEPPPEDAEQSLEILGKAPAMQEVFRAIGRLSSSHVTVLITGESGTGKELVARALHDHSPRASHAFVALNTAAIPRDLLESELFGHERGAFTGAQQLRRGRFEQAEGGTLFLDEIGDMPPDLQTRLLRVLADGQFYRVGGHQPLKANVRVIAATHQNLEERVRKGLFREDLFHRLNVIRLRLPPLRERHEDIPVLARHFLQRSARELGVEPKRLTDEALTALSAFSWPGNVRQLENVCHWLNVMAPSQTVGVADLPPEVRDAASAAAAHAAAVHAAAANGLRPLAAGTSEAAIGATGVPGGVGAGPSAAGAPGAGMAGAGMAGAGMAGGHGAGAAVDGFHAPAAVGVVGARDADDRAMAVPPLGMPMPRPGLDAGSAAAAGLPPAQALQAAHWAALLEREVSAMLSAQSPEMRSNGQSDVMDQLTRVFESAVIRTALRHTRGRRIDAALRLGIGRNTITRKIQDLHLEDDEV
ncbi:MAG TPA: nitrogen regulation protein NR(I) [Quisquiliibacterium sp.]|nr:nitrogen regulation protein NR(I) [Quisquiliibacterium sp.]